MDPRLASESLGFGGRKSNVQIRAYYLAPRKAAESSATKQAAARPRQAERARQRSLVLVFMAARIAAHAAL
jgi:hypothetical protein